MPIPPKERGAGNWRSATLTTVFFLIVGSSLHYFATQDVLIDNLIQLHPMELFVLSLAVFRFTRLLVYDSVAQFIRDIFLDCSKETDTSGVVMVKRCKPATGWRRLFADLLDCPWCTGVWAALFVTLLYLVFPWTWFFWLFMAIAGVSSFFMLLANLIGWQAEKAKLEVERMKNR